MPKPSPGRRPYPTGQAVRSRYGLVDGRLCHRSGPRAGKPAGRWSNSGKSAHQGRLLRLACEGSDGKVTEWPALLLAWIYHHGEAPVGRVCAVNGDQTIHARENLRVDHSRPTMTPRKGKPVGQYVAEVVSERTGRVCWEARTYQQGQLVYLGRHESKEEALAAIAEYQATGAKPLKRKSLSVLT